MFTNLSDIYPVEENIKKLLSIGNILKLTNTEEYYIVANSDINEVVLICLTDGQRWADPIKVKDVNAITRQEAIELTGKALYHFQRIEYQFYIKNKMGIISYENYFRF